MEKAKWVWLHDEEKKDEHVQFCDKFIYDGGNAVIKLSCDTNYILYVNGSMAGCGQYNAYPDMRVFDTIDITKYLNQGENQLAIHVWYWGSPAMVYSVGKAGLSYTVTCDGKAVAYSSENTLCRQAKEYEQGKAKYINRQQGLTYFYNPNFDDGFGKENYIPNGFTNAVVRDIPCKNYDRPNQKLNIERTRIAKLIDRENKVYDLGFECAGVLHIIYRAKKNRKFKVCFGEYVKDDGNVLRFFDAHDYTLNYVGNGKEVEHVAYLRRIGCRYLQVLGDDVDVMFLGLKETPYPVKVIPFTAENERIKDIYNTCLRTLLLCMHEHYEDCPWREQVLYNMDSRNAMLCTYEALGDSDFAKSNLWLMQFAPNKDGFYPASFPSGDRCWSIIPIFNLIYVVQSWEYLEYSGDKQTVKEIYPRLKDTIDNFLRRLENGLFKEVKGIWNFIEWSFNMEGHEENSGNRTSLVVNGILIMALQSLMKISNKIGIDCDYSKEIELIRKSMFEKFYDADRGVFKSYVEEDHTCELGNAIAVLSGAAFEKKNEIIDKLASGTLQKASLAMKCYLYDALLLAGDKYNQVIIDDILRDYGYMLDKGATSFWESLEGEKQYGGAGSLCHVWSATPIIYLKKLGLIKQEIK